MVDKFNINIVPTQIDWLHGNTVFLTKHGSHAYGLNISSSDVDVKGFAVPPKSYVFGLKKFEQTIVQNENFDVCIYDIKKFFALAADCNPSIIEVLWTDESDHLIKTGIGAEILFQRDLFLSKKAKHTFSGYAVSQLKRIQTHRRWLLNPVEKPPTRAEFGLSENPKFSKSQKEAIEFLLKKKIESWNFDDIEINEVWREKLIEKLTAIKNDWIVENDLGSVEELAARRIGFDTDLIEIIKKENAFKTKLIEWKQYNEWKQNRNKARFETEQKYGYDTKHAMHLIRLLTMCEEILTKKIVCVKRQHDKDFFLGIRNGMFSFDELLEMAKKKEESLESLYRKSDLKNRPDLEKIEQLLINSYEKFYGEKHALQSRS